jgi:hypothetical protein
MDELVRSNVLTLMSLTIYFTRKEEKHSQTHKGGYIFNRKNDRTLVVFLQLLANGSKHMRF